MRKRTIGYLPSKMVKEIIKKLIAWEHICSATEVEKLATVWHKASLQWAPTHFLDLDKKRAQPTLKAGLEIFQKNNI